MTAAVRRATAAAALLAGLALAADVYAAPRLAVALMTIVVLLLAGCLRLLALPKDRP